MVTKKLRASWEANHGMMGSWTQHDDSAEQSTSMVWVNKLKHILVTNILFRFSSVIMKTNAYLLCIVNAFVRIEQLVGRLFARVGVRIFELHRCTMNKRFYSPVVRLWIMFIRRWMWEWTGDVCDRAQERSGTSQGREPSATHNGKRIAWTHTGLPYMSCLNQAHNKVIQWCRPNLPRANAVMIKKVDFLPLEEVRGIWSDKTK